MTTKSGGAMLRKNRPMDCSMAGLRRFLRLLLVHL